MLGSTSPRMLGIGLPVVDSWNVWWSIYDNSVESFAQVKAEVDAAMPQGRTVDATAAVLVTLPGGRGRLMGDHYDTPVTTVTPDDLVEHVRGLGRRWAPPTCSSCSTRSRPSRSTWWGRRWPTSTGESSGPRAGRLTDCRCSGIP